MIRNLNTFSNAAYAFAGIGGFLVGGTYAAFFLAACAFLAIGSALYHRFYEHEKYGKWFQAADEIGMYLVLFTLVVHTSAIGAGVGMVVLALLWVLSAALWPKINSHILIPYGAVFLMGALFQSSAYEALGAALFMGGGFVLHLIDRPRYHGGLHWLWHILSAIAVFLTYYWSHA